MRSGALSTHAQPYPLEGVYVGCSKISVVYDIYKHLYVPPVLETIF